MAHRGLHLQSTRTQGQLVPKLSRTHGQLVPKLTRSHGQVVPKSCRTQGHLVPKYKRNAKKCSNLCKVANVNKKCHLQCHGNSQIQKNRKNDEKMEKNDEIYMK